MKPIRLQALFGLNYIKDLNFEVGVIEFCLSPSYSQRDLYLPRDVGLAPVNIFLDSVPGFGYYNEI